MPDVYAIPIHLYSMCLLCNVLPTSYGHVKCYPSVIMSTWTLFLDGLQPWWVYIVVVNKTSITLDDNNITIILDDLQQFLWHANSYPHVLFDSLYRICGLKGIWHCWFMGHEVLCLVLNHLFRISKKNQNSIRYFFMRFFSKKLREKRFLYNTTWP